MEGLEGIVGTFDKVLLKFPKTTSIASGLVTTLSIESYIYAISTIASGEENPIIHVATLGIGAIVGNAIYKRSIVLQGFKDLNLNFDNIRKLKTTKLKTNPNKNRIQRILDSPFEHPKISGAIISASLGLRKAQDIYISAQKLLEGTADLENMFLLTVVPLGMSAVYLASKKMFEVGSSIFHSSNFSLQKEFWKAYFSNKFSRKDNFLSTFKQITDKFQYMPLTLEYADACVEKGKPQDSFEALLTVYDQTTYSDQRSLWSQGSFNNFKELFQKYYKRIKANSNSYSSYFGLSLLLESAGERKASLKIMERFNSQANKNPYISLQANLSYAVFLGKIGENKLFRSQLLKVLELNRDKLSRIGSFDMYQISDSDFSRHTFAIRKNDDRKPLDDEHKNTQTIRDNFSEVNDESQFRIMMPPEVFDFDNQFYSATFFEQGVTLAEYLNTTKDVKALEDIARFTARIHGSNPVYEPVNAEHYLNILITRLNEVSDTAFEDVKKIILDYIPLLFEGFDQFERVVDIDAHRENWIVGQNYTKIDMQKREPTIPFFEISKLLEQGNRIPNNIAGDIIREQVIASYYNELSNFYPLSSLGEFEFFKLKADPIKAFSYAAVALPDSSKHLVASQFLANASYSLSRLKNHMASSAELECLNNLERANDLMQEVLS